MCPFHFLFFFYTVDEGASSAIPIIIEGSTHDVDSIAVPQTPDDASFDLAPFPALLKVQDTVKIMLLGIIQAVTNGSFTKLASCRRAMNRAPLDIRPLRAIFDKLFAYLESLKDLHTLGPTALFQQEEGRKLTSLQAQVNIRR